MWVSSGTAAVKAGGLAGGEGGGQRRLDRARHELRGDRRRRGTRPRLAAGGVDGGDEAVADLGLPAQRRAAGHVDLDQQAAGDEGALLGEGARSRRAPPAAPGASRSSAEAAPRTLAWSRSISSSWAAA